MILTDQYDEVSPYLPSIKSFRAEPDYSFVNNMKKSISFLLFMAV